MQASRLSATVSMSKSVSKTPISEEEAEKRSAIRAELISIHRKMRKDWTDEDRDFIKAVFLQEHRDNGGNVSASCRRAGIDTKTYYNWCNPTYSHYDQEFAEASLEVAEECDDYVESALYRNALEGNHSSQAFWLTNRRPGKWKSVHHHNTVANVNVQGVGNMSFDQALEIVKASGLDVPEPNPDLAPDIDDEEE